jgi:DNA ligase (NAD+)
MIDNNLSEIRQLIDKLNYYTKLYDEGHPEISDIEWDNLYFKLQKLENQYHTYCEDSPTQKVNFQVVNKLNKVEHNHPMLSLDKTKDMDVIKSFIAGKEFICMAKMDGLTCSLTYQNGQLVAAETRGNGIVGEDILHNALQVKNIPNKIDFKDKLVVDGEIICTYSDFEPFAEEYKNPRNFASGSIRLLDSKESSNRRLSFVAWDCIEGYNDKYYLSTKLAWLNLLGFTIVPCFAYGIPYTTVHFDEDIEELKNRSKRLGYPIDGLVFKYDNCDEYNTAGRTDHHFKGGIAYKFYDEEYETTLQDIEWSIGRTGILTPVAIFDPVDIDGTEVSRASLHNVSVMTEILGQPYKGQKIKVFKANMIIPQISWAEIKPLTISTFRCEKCPLCGERTVLKNNDGVMTLYCSNPDCEGKLINRLDHFCGKKGLDIKGLSKATLEKLIDWSWISSYMDIYNLENFSNEWKNKTGFGEKSVERILSALEQSKNTTLDKVIAAAGIPLIGTRVAKDLSQYYSSWEDFRKETNFEKYDGIGPEMNNSLLNFDYTEIDKVIPYLNISATNNNKDNTLQDKVFCITGKLHIWKNRDELIKSIESMGGRVVGSMSSKVDYLVNNDINSTSAKNNAAKQAGIPIITEEELQSMI